MSVGMVHVNVPLLPSCHPAWDTESIAVVRAFARGAMGRRIDPSWGGPIELFLVPTSAPRLV